MAVRLVMDPVGMARLREKAGDFAHTAAKMILMDIYGDVPIDTGAVLRSLRLERRRWNNGRRHSTRIWVGTKHWAYTEYGTPPHKIRAIRRTYLRNPKTGQVFGTEVNHPGIREMAWIRRNFYKRRVIVRLLP